MSTIKEMTEQAIKLNGGKMLVKKVDVQRIFGGGRNRVDQWLANVVPCGGKSTYYIRDVVEGINRHNR